MKRNLIFAVAMLVVAFGAMGQAPYAANPLSGPTTLNDYESCDVAVMPAATLLLPYFEVAPDGLGENTLVTITNISDTAIVAHVTVWTDWSFPVLDFNLFLTGYDVVSMSLRDLLVSGTIPNTGRSELTASPWGVRSRYAPSTAGNPTRIQNFTFTGCDVAQGGAGAIPTTLLSAVQSALTGGPYIAGTVQCDYVGDEHENMIGYMTIDTSAFCSQTLPTVSTYWTTEVRFENQLIGDYIRLNDADGYAGASPLVHIKALPGGYSSGGTISTTLPWTFYSRYQAAATPRNDRRQPLPALFAARYVETPFNTDFAVWREGFTDELATPVCVGGDPYAIYNSRYNSDFTMTEVVRFDERENPQTIVGGCRVSPCENPDGTNETQLINIANNTYIPADPSSDTGGWVFFNASIPDGVPTFHHPGNRPSQNWIQVRMTGGGIYGVDFDAAYLGNGCQLWQAVTITDGGIVDGNESKIGPKYIRGSATGWIYN